MAKPPATIATTTAARAAVASRHRRTDRVAIGHYRGVVGARAGLLHPPREDLPLELRQSSLVRLARGRPPPKQPVQLCAIPSAHGAVN